MEECLKSLTAIIRTELLSVIDVPEINFDSQLNKYLTSDTDKYLEMNKHQLLKKCCEHSLKLYKLVTTFLGEYFTTCRNNLTIPLEGFLKIYLKYFNETFTVAKTVSSTYCYLNMIWSNSYKENGSDKPYNLSQMILASFVKNYFSPLYKTIKNEVFQIISQHRVTKKGNLEIVRSYCEHLYKLPFAIIQKFDLNILPTDRIFYKVYFEDDFLTETANYYDCSNIKYKNKSDQAYIELVSSILEEEDYRIKTYFHPKTSQLIIKSLGETFIGVRSEAFSKEFGKMFFDINSCNKFCKQICIKMNGDCNVLKESFISSFLTELSHVFSLEIFNTDTQLFFKSLKDCFEKYKHLTMKFFNGSFILKKQLNTVMSEVLYDSFSKEKPSFDLFSKLLAKYTHIHLIRHTEKTRARNKLNDFSFIRDLLLLLIDKKYYINNSLDLFMSRFLQNKSISIEYENDFLNLIDDISTGHELEKFQRILNDYISNYNIMNKLIQSLSQDKYIENVRILSKFNSIQYPIKIFKCYEYNFYDKKCQEIPLKFSYLVKSFESIYNEIFPAAKIKWLESESSTKINLKFKGASYYIYASLTQAAILSLFNDKLSYTESEIMDNIKVNRNQLLVALSLLIDNKLLIKTSKDSGVPSSEKIDWIEYNELFSSNITKINVMKPTTAEVGEKIQKVNLQQSLNVEYNIRPAILKCVKFKGTCNKKNILNYILEKEKNLSMATDAMIEKNLEILVKSGRITRSVTDINLYSYVASK